MRKPNLAILLEFGFHEIKKYVHSGFAQELSKEFNIIWFALDKGSEEFDNYFRATGYPIIYFQDKDFKHGLSSLERYNQSVRRNWMVNQDLGAFHNHTQVRTKNWKTTFYGNSLFKRMLEGLTLKYIRNNYGNQNLSKAFNKNAIEHVLTTGYSSNFAKSAVITAQKQQIKVHYLVNSWKDLFIDNFMPFNQLASIFVWSEVMKENYLRQMPYLKSEKIIVSGNPTFDVLLNATPNYDRNHYATKYNISENAKWLLYTMMPVGIAKDEIETIFLTARELEKVYSSDEFVVLVRKNPTHSKSDFNACQIPNNVRILEHFCTFDKKNDMIIQSNEGEAEWLDLLIHSELNLSVPSTVSLEFESLNKPVLNIAYNSKGQKDERINQFFEAGFYQYLFESKAAIKINQPSELLNYIEGGVNQLRNKLKNRELRASTTIVDSLKKQ